MRDAEGYPIEGAFVSEGPHFVPTRSDAEGRYQLRLELPVRRYPVLHSLRSGFERREFSHRPSAQANELNIQFSSIE